MPFKITSEISSTMGLDESEGFLYVNIGRYIRDNGSGTRSGNLEIRDSLSCDCI